MYAKKVLLVFSEIKLMLSNNHFHDTLATAGLVIASIYSVYTCIRDIRRQRKEIREKRLEILKHNCVVFYTKDFGMSGWPAYEGRVVLDVLNIDKFYEPLVHFITTAQKTLDIAVMNINIKPVIDALEIILKRGVKVRLILDYHFMKSDKSVSMLQNSGALINYYIHFDIDTLMHYKYAVKDYDPNTETGFALCGSMNWTVCSVIENYEEILFTSNSIVVKNIQNNFSSTWQLLVNDLKNTEDAINSGL